MNNGFIKKLLLVIVSVSLSLILVEFLLYIDNDSTVYKQFRYKINNVAYYFNDDPNDFLNNKLQEKTVFLGDSYTEGAVCASEKKDFVNMVKSQMGTECKSSTYNFGAYARGPADYLNIYSYFKKKNLKKVIVVLNYNDIEMNTHACQTLKELRNSGYPKINKVKMN